MSETTVNYRTLIVAAILTIVVGLISWSFRSNIESVYQKINDVNESSCKANEIQWRKISDIEKEMAYMRGFRDGYLKAVESRMDSEERK